MSKPVPRSLNIPNAKYLVLVGLALTGGISLAVQSPSSKLVEGKWETVRVDSNVINYRTGAEKDARQIEGNFRQTIETLKKEFEGPDTIRQLNAIELTVYIHDRSNELASEATATLESSFKKPKYFGTLHMLQPSLHSPQARTSANEPKDAAYFHKVITHEYSTMLLDLITQEKSDSAWRFYSAPSWFVQGYEEYLGLFCSSEHSRTESYKRYLEITRSSTLRVRNDFGLYVQDAYVDGAVMVKFMHDIFGKQRVQAVLRSSAPTFGEAIKKELGVGLDEFFDRWRAWLAAPSDK